jgi:MinD-like ATPase involved in chromosome partitioning or flagellar assembly
VTLPALTAVTPRWEGAIAGHLEGSDHVHVARRCADLTELLGCAAAGVGRLAVVSVDLRGVDRTAVATLVDHGLSVLGVHPPLHEDGRLALVRWGVEVVLPADASAEALDAALSRLLAGPAGSPGQRSTSPSPHSDEADPDREPTPSLRPTDGGDDPVSSAPERVDDTEAQPGRVVAVWGPTGAPGRSTVAVNVAAELGREQPVLLVDADTYGASHAQMLAILDEAPGVAAATRAADHGTLDAAALTQLAPLVQDQLRVLTGLPRADRWPELREHALADVLSTAGTLWPWTVVDVGFCLEQDEEISYDTAAPRRNGPALRVLEAADEVVVVGSADPIGLQRLVRAVTELRSVVGARPRVVVTRVRASAVGPDPEHRVREVLHRFGGIDQVHLIPEDRDAVDAALLQGTTLSEARPASPARLALAELADALAGRSPSRSRRASLLRRRRA